MPIRILFVCYENICRSPMAEGAFGALVSSMGAGAFFEAESAGTVGYQSGCCPDDRAVWAAGRYGIDISTIRARCLDDLDLDRFDRIFVMDFENQRDLLEVLGDCPVPVHLMTDFAESGAGREIEDPYYGEQEGFDRTMEIIMQSAREILMAMQEVYGGVASNEESDFQFTGYDDEQ